MLGGHHHYHIKNIPENGTTQLQQFCHIVCIISNIVCIIIIADGLNDCCREVQQY
jgi:hypothetical protein